MRPLLPPFPPYSSATELGLVTPSCAFLTPAEPDPAAALLAIGISSSTGLLSLLSALPPESLIQSHSWLTQNEPQGHLAHVISFLEDQGRELKTRSVLGLTIKDSSTLDLLSPLVAQTALLSLPTHMIDCTATRQDFIATGPTDSEVEQSPVDLVVCRHLLEHAYDLHAFLSGISGLLVSTGRVLFEVPDCARAIQFGDYTILWEEHVHYFTPDSLRSTLEASGWAIDAIHTATADGEDVIWCLAQPPTIGSHPTGVRGARRAPASTRRFCERFSVVRGGIASQLRDDGVTRTVVIGANHIASTTLDLFMPSDHAVTIVDDSLDKHGHQLSRRRIPVVSLEAASIRPTDSVLVAINHSRAAGVIDRLNSNPDTAGRFLFLSQWFEFIYR